MIRLIIHQKCCSSKREFRYVPLHIQREVFSLIKRKKISLIYPKMSQRKKVLMICLGNICRSPIAEAVFDNEISKRSLNDHWEVESAALIGYHTGKKPDHRALSTLKENGITNYSHRARPITQADFDKFDWIFGMDHDNMQELINLKPKACRAKVELLGTYDPNGEIVIRDPYYDSGSGGFQKAYEQCLRSVIAFFNKHAN